MENAELEQLQKAEQVAGFGSFTWDLDTDEMTWSTGLYMMLRIDEVSHPNPSLALLQSMTREDYRERVKVEAQATAESAQPYQAEYPVCPHDDGVIWIRIKGDRVNVHGRQSVVGVMLDITEQIADREKFAQLNENLVDALDRSQDLIALLQRTYGYNR